MFVAAEDLAMPTLTVAPAAITSKASHRLSLPGLTWQSIDLRKKLFAKEDGCAGQARA
jgi:hypothetical protein